MEYYQQIFTIATFALYSFIFSLFIVPTIKNLKQIQQKLRKIIKPRTLFPNQTKRDGEIKKQKSEFIEILEEYKLEYKDVDGLRRSLIYGVIITFVSIISIFILNADYFTTNLFVLFFFLIGIVILIVGAFKTYIPSPREITEWIYMCEHFNLSPTGIEKCADLEVDYNYEDTTFSEFDPKLKRKIKIHSDIELRGYKCWIFIYDSKNKKIIFNVIKTINKKADLIELMPDTEYKKWSVEISEFDAYEHRENKELKMFFFVFDPITFGNAGSPYWGYKDLEFKENVSFSSGYKLGLYGGTFVYIKYSGEKLNFKKLQWQENIPIQPGNKELFGIIKEVFEISKGKLI